MAKIIRNSRELNSVLKQVAYKMLSQAREEVYNAIQKSIEEYYKEYTPSRYKRTYRFLSSLVKTEVKQRGNELWCEVKIDEDYLKYAYPYPNDFYPKSYPQDYDGRPALGLDVVNWANRKFPDDEDEGYNHGYTIDAGRNDGFWDGALEELGDILLILKKNLKKQGIKVV